MLYNCIAYMAEIDKERELNAMTQDLGSIIGDVSSDLDRMIDVAGRMVNH